MKVFSKIYMGLCFLLLYAPILVVIIFSFNESGSLSTFSQFSFKWYGELFRDDEALTALKNSLILAVLSSTLATILGTMAALWIYRTDKKRFASIAESVSNIPMMNPDIVTGVSMMLLFVGVATILNFTDALGFGTMLIAHTTFSLPYVILSVLPKFRALDNSLYEASLDLGCNPLQAFFKVEMPQILPGVFSGFLLGFTLSLDDFVISHFVSSPDFKTLPLYIYNQTAHEVKFSMYALCTLMILAIVVLLFAANYLSYRSEKKEMKKMMEGKI